MPIAEPRTVDQLMLRHESSLDSLQVPIRNIVLMIRDHVPETANAFAKRYSGARIHILGTEPLLTKEQTQELLPQVTFKHASSERDRADYLLRAPRPQVIIEAGNRKRAHKVSSLREFLFFVAPKGIYIADELQFVGDPNYDNEAGPNVLDVLTEVAQARALQGIMRRELPQKVAALARAVESITFNANSATVHRNSDKYLLKVREWEADSVLAAHCHSSRHTVIERRPAYEYESRASVLSHGDGPIAPGAKRFNIPERVIRRYKNVICTAQQVARIDDFLLPDSWRHPHQRVLYNRQLEKSATYADRYTPTAEPTIERNLAGSYFYLDTEVPGHFGHVTTEVLSRMWAWDLVKMRDPAARVLVSLASQDRALPEFQTAIFGALDISLDQIETIAPDEAVTVETLYGATPQLENPYYIDPDITRTWQRLAENLPAGSEHTSEKIFISRKNNGNRHCLQTAEIEEFFSCIGFTILFPEDHPYVTQTQIFRHAKIIAGFGGSGLFNMMFAPSAKVLVISGDSYDAQNEHLIAGANGNEIHYFWGSSLVSRPLSGRFSLPAFMSDFNFNLGRFRDDLLQSIG